MHLRHSAALLGTVASLALVAGCATPSSHTAQQESSGYLSHARGNYQAPGPASDPWGPYIREASSKYDVPEKWVREVMRQESGGHLFGRGGELITSGAGAMGLMQVMPATYDDLRGRYRELGDDPYDPHNNILAGTAYLREMYDIYGAPGFLAAYNAGPGRLDDYLTRSRTLPTETRRYVAAIGPRIAGYEPQRQSPGAMYAMNATPLDVSGGPRMQMPAPQFAATVPAPVEVAEAPRSFIKLNPPEPAPAPVVVAQAAPTPYIVLNPPQPDAPDAFGPAEPPRQYIKLNPPQRTPSPVVVADAEPSPRMQPPQPQWERPYEPARSALGRSQMQAARELPIPEPPPPPPLHQFARQMPQGGNHPIEVAEFAEPRFRSQRAAAAAELASPGPRSRSGFGLISSAYAAPASRAVPIVSAKSGAWAVQVGAFSNETLAHSATTSARGQAHEMLGGAQTMVAGVRQPGGTLYRARLGGLSHDAAAQACERLSRARTNCMVVSPSAQR